MPKRYQVLLLCIIPVILIILVFFPAPYTFQQNKNDVQIEITLNRRWVIAFNQCVQLNWNFVGAREVYLNNEGRVGNDAESVCVTPANQLQIFRVVYPDGTDEIITIRVGTLVQAPEVWFFAILEILLMVFVTLGWVSKSRQYLWIQRRFLRGLSFLGVVFIILIFVEFGLRWYFDAYGSDSAKARYLYTDEEIELRSNLNAIPFLNYGSIGSEGNLGFRQTQDVAIPKPKGVFRIVTLGGSTTYGLGMETINAYPAKLEKILNEEYGYSVEVINAGVLGYNSWNSVVMLAFRALEVEPDLIIVYDSVNDVSPRTLNPECYRGENYFRGIQPNAGVLQLRSLGLPQITLLRVIGINLGWLPDPLTLGTNIRAVIACAYDDVPTPREELMDINTPTYFERNLISMVGIAEVHQAQMMLSTWTYNQLCTDDVCPAWWKKAIIQQNEVIRAVATDYSTHFFDLAQTDMPTIPENWFGDFTHQSEVGAEAQARYYAQYIVENILSKRGNASPN